MEHEAERAANMKDLLKILSNLQFLAKQGLSFRGDMAEIKSNFMQLCRLCGESDSKLLIWLKIRTDKYTSAEMQNEMLQDMVLKQIAIYFYVLADNRVFSIIADETMHLSNQKQLVIYVRRVE